ncbi:MAG: glycosyltransferase family 4 protein [Cytophagales bacterium]|nr:glycosyltransferase family 4 protein [Cytophagales bacterium]
MKILVYTSLFYPSVGGMETVVLTLAQEFARCGHEVKVVTYTPAAGADPGFPFEVVRQPSREQLLALTRWCEVYYQACISLKGLWPLLYAPRTLFVTHHTWYRRIDGTVGWQDRLKLLVCRFAQNIAISRAIAEHIPGKLHVIANPYRAEFRKIEEVARRKAFIFLGRLVSDKGADLLLEALRQVRDRGLDFHCTITGEGPEKESLQQLARQYDLAGRVTFTGTVTGENLVRLLNEHHVMVVPSRWKEPFGVVALEAIACGCVVVGSSGGGLPEAIGPCGVTFRNGDADQLADRLSDLLTQPEALARYRAPAAAHLSKHSARQIGEEYLRLFAQHVSYPKKLVQRVAHSLF